MIALIRGEMIKVRTTRTAIGFLIAGVLLVLLFVLVQLLAADPRSLVEKRQAISISGSLSVPLLIYGIVGATSEFRHRTLASSLLVWPQRGQLTFARMIAYGFSSLLIALVMVIIASVLGLALMPSAGASISGSDYLEIAGGGLLSVVLSTMIGVGAGVLIRNQVAAVVGALVWLFIAEPLMELISKDLVKFTISHAGTSLSGAKGDTYLSFGSGALVLLAWATLLVVVGVIVDARRDVT